MKQQELVEKILSAVAVGDRLAVAVSGGRDSMALLHAVLSAKNFKAFSFFAVNIEHGLRGDASVADSKFVKDYCEKNNVEFCGFSVDCKSFAAENGLSTEDAARRLRYGVFEKLLDENKCDKVLTAHHLSDQAETVLMRIIRGTGVKGLSAMQSERRGIVRPFLDVTRAEIDEYVKVNDIPFVTDESNFDNAYTRNLLRNELIPAMKKISAGVEGALVRLSRLAAENEDFISACDNPVEIGEGCCAMPIIANEHKLLFKRRVVKCFFGLGVTQDIEERHQDIIYGLLDKPNGASLDMPYGVKVTREYNKIVFTKAKSAKKAEVLFGLNDFEFCGKRVLMAECDGTKNKGELLFDFDKIPDGALFRHRAQGDKFTKFGGCTKSLSDYLTDIKIPLRLRDDVIVLAKDNDVLMVLGIEISDKIKTDNHTVKIYKLTLSEV